MVVEDEKEEVEARSRRRRTKRRKRRRRRRRRWRWRIKREVGGRGGKGGGRESVAGVEGGGGKSYLNVY